jgi:hypothetical protein
VRSVQHRTHVEVADRTSWAIPGEDTKLETWLSLAGFNLASLGPSTGNQLESSAFVRSALLYRLFIAKRD